MLHMCTLACGGHRTTMSATLQMPYTMFINTGCLIGQELAKQARGDPPASDSSVLSFQVSFHMVIFPWDLGMALRPLGLHDKHFTS